MSLQTSEKVRKLQKALHAKAKEAPDYRFYLLYDKIYRADILQFAYRCCRQNGRAVGVEGQKFDDIESYGIERWLGELAEGLRNKTYQPEVVRRVFILPFSGTKVKFHHQKENCPLSYRALIALRKPSIVIIPDPRRIIAGGTGTCETLCRVYDAVSGSANRKPP